MSYKLPPNGQWTQKNIGDTFGSLWSSFNLDLTIKKGDTKITRLIHSQSTSSDLANLGTPVGFVKIDAGGGLQNAPFYTVAGARVFLQGAFTSASFLQDSQTGTPTTCDSTISDLASFNTYLYVTAASNSVYKTQGAAWTTFTAGAADSSGPHGLCAYGSRMYYARVKSQIISWDTTDTVATSGQYTLTIPNANENTITFMRAASDRIWIGTVNTIGGQGHIYSWDGSSGNPVKYNLDSTGAMAGVVKDDVLYVMDNNGRLLAFNGGTFVEVGKLPNYTKFAFVQSLSSTNDRWIHPNGMAIVEGKINILINSAQVPTTTTEETCPSGIYEYDKDIGLYHKYSFSYYDRIAGAITDYGQSRISVVGGLAYAKPASTSSASNGTLLAGCKYYTNASSTQYGIFYDDNTDTALKAGYLVSTKIAAQGVIDAWQALVLKYNNLYSTSDKIVTKYRMTDYDPIEATITWTSTTTFTTTTDPSAYWTSGTGFEVEIVQGTGAGMCSHITSIVNNAGTYTVTVDETHTGVTSGTAIARFQKWIKVDSTVASDITSSFNYFGLSQSASSNWIQIKVWMLMYGRDELKEIDLQSAISKPL